MNPRTHNQHEEDIAVAGRDYRCLFRREVDSGYRVTCAVLPPMLAFGETLIEAWIDEENRTRNFTLIDRQGRWWPSPA